MLNLGFVFSFPMLDGSLVPLPPNKPVVGCRWLNTVEIGPNGKVDRPKARLVAKGYIQVFGIDYTDIFSPVAKSQKLLYVLFYPRLPFINGPCINWIFKNKKKKLKMLVGNLLYLTITHQYISYAVSVVSQFLQFPCEGHWEAVVRILRNIKKAPGIVCNIKSKGAQKYWVLILGIRDLLHDIVSSLVGI